MTSPENLFQETAQLIQINFSSTSSNSARQEAIQKLHVLLQLENPALVGHSFEIAFGLIRQSRSESDSMLEYAVYYGFQLLINIVRLKWQALSPDEKQRIFDLTVECARNSSVINNQNQSVKLALGSPLVLNSCTQLICDIFVRTYPAQWASFVGDCIQNLSILAPTIFLNISEMINDLIIPKNPSRRKEIIACLDNDSSAMFEYFKSVLSTNGPHCLKVIKALGSLFQWFRLDASTVTALLDFILRHYRCGLDDVHSLELQFASYQCVLGLLNRPKVNRFEDSLVMREIFFTLEPQSFTEHLITEALLHHLSLVCDPSAEEPRRLLMVVTEIAVEIMTTSLELSISDSEHPSIRKKIQENPNVWGKWLKFLEHCFSQNNALVDELLLKFEVYFSRFVCSSASQAVENEEPSSQLLSPVDASFHREHISEVFRIILLHKNDPKSEEKARDEELVWAGFDEYENYLEVFRSNRSKFITFMINSCQNHPDVVRDFLLNLFGFMLGPVTTFEKMPVVPNWNCFLFMISTLLPRLDFDSQNISILERHFEKLLQESLNTDHSIDSLSNILSCLSSMAPLYKHFAPNLINVLLERIFHFALQPDQDISRHSTNLFIHLAIERASILIEHFDSMCHHADQLFESNQISHWKYFSLIEGLVVLSNHFKDDVKQQVYISTLLRKIDWIRSYDFGENGINFCRDAEINILPPRSTLPTQQESSSLWMNKFFMDFRGSLRLVSIIFKRLNPKICSKPEWLTLMDYVLPFFKFIPFLNTYWKMWKSKNTQELSKFIAPEYFEQFFEELPFKFYSNLLQDRKFLFESRDRLGTLKWQWNSSVCSSSDELYTQLKSCFVVERFQTLFCDEMSFAHSVFNYLFTFHQNLPPTYRGTIENLTATYLEQLHHGFSDLPLVYTFDMMLLVSNYTALCPRDEEFLRQSKTIEFLNSYLEIVFRQLNPWFVEPRPDVGGDHLLEIIIETLYTIFSNKFVMILFTCKKMDNSLQNWIDKFDKHSEAENNDEESMELVSAMKDCNLVRPKIGSQEDLQATPLTLLKLMLASNWSIADIALQLLKWPLQREKICLINEYMIDNIMAQGALNSVDKITSILTNILQAIAITEKNEFSVIKMLVKLFAQLYEKIALAGYSIPFNVQLGAVTGVDVSEWNRFASNLSTPKYAKSEEKKLRDLKSLLEGLCRKPLSQQHVIEQPNIEALFKESLKKKVVSPSWDLDSSLAALFGES